MGAGEGASRQLVWLFFPLDAFHFSHQRGTGVLDAFDEAVLLEFVQACRREFASFNQPMKWLKGLHFLGGCY